MNQIVQVAPTKKVVFSFLVGLLYLVFSFSSSAQFLRDDAMVKILAAKSNALRINKFYFQDILSKRGVPFENGQYSEDFLQSGGCGSVAIGNQFGNSSQTLPSEISIVIVGDILNVGNTCGI